LDIFHNEGRKVCCKVSLYKNCLRQSCSVQLPFEWYHRRVVVNVFIVSGHLPTPLAYVTADGSRCRDTAVPSLRLAGSPPPSPNRSQCCMITLSRRRHAIEKTPYRQSVESACWRAVGGAHHWQAAGSDCRCVADESRHRPANVGHGRRPTAVIRQVVPGRPVGRQGLGVV